MFSLGGGELVVILLLILIFFGPDAFPEIARLLARAYKMLLRAGQEVSELIREAGGEELMEVTSLGRRELLNLGTGDQAEKEGATAHSGGEDSLRELDDYLLESRSASSANEPAPLSRGLPEHLVPDDYLGREVRDGG